MSDLGDLTGVSADEWVVKCPFCGLIETLENFDVVGADEGNVFCNRCGHEIPNDPKPLSEIRGPQ